MKSILSYIPGFRSNVLWKKIVASIYYIIAMTSLTDSVGLFLFVMSLPFLVFSTYDLFRWRDINLKIEQAFIPFVISLAMFFTGLAVMPRNDLPKSQKSNKTSESVILKQSAHSNAYTNYNIC